eukprot:gnl/MRDRNA2_/MRDRNA2_116844_c0_seq1.p1 gnl/MRDRNA2_/MRDRNA2_116844_c0~~gnl/MRDRNA2_/MRDRNA2_116844_c0_seq1.p1  ORF type:complete len:733 (+),score=145.44 gnl/MRDRNA2_/MRDRNA2_116844_c0_seq1:125-2200(+)
MSAKLTAQVSRAGLACLKPMLEQAGVMTYACLAAMSKDELNELCTRVRAAGFGLGHARALRELCSEALAEASTNREQPPDRLDEAPVLPSSLSPMLYFRLARKGLRELEPVLAQCGVHSVTCLGKLNEEERGELANAIAAAGFDANQALSDMSFASATTKVPPKSMRPKQEQIDRASESTQESIVRSPSEPPEGNDSDSMERPAKRPKVAQGSGSSDEKTIEDPTIEKEVRAPLRVKQELREAKKLPVQSMSQTEGDDGSSTSLESFSMGPSKLRVSRESINKVVQGMKAVPAQIVRYRDKATGKLEDARIPSLVMALVRLRASCTGKPVSEDRIARLAVDVMKESAYDPIRAFASLLPAELQIPSSAVRILGAGAIGVVFMEEETGVVSKVMLEDFAEQEYEVFCAFANAGLAARPIGFEGPKVVPGGSLYSIHMERIQHTLEGVLHERERRGPRHGLNPLTECSASRIGEAMVRALQGMWDNGLVHGDLHLGNVAVKDPQLQPFVQLLDFGRAARNIRAAQSASTDALRAGHEYDVFRLMEEMCNDFDELKEQTTEELKECKKEITELRRGCQAASMLSSWAPKMQEMVNQLSDKCKDDPSNEFQSQLHDARQIAGLQAYIAEEPEALAKLEAVYNIILSSVVQYARTKLDFQFDGATCWSNRKMRGVIAKRQRLGFHGYFKSHLFWGS